MRSHHASRAPKRRSRTAARALALLCSVGIAAALGPVIASVPDSFGDPPAACAAPADALAGVWRPARLEVLATCRLVTGVVRGVHRQVDGDLTFELLPDRPYRALANRVNRRKLRGALYVELPPRDGGHLYAPSRGDHVTLEGALVTDRGERWNELHPVFAEQIGRGPTFRSGPQFGGSPPSADAFGAAERCRDASAHRCEGFTGAFGQCLPATSGAYSDGACTAPAPGGRYEWHPAPEALASLAGAAFTTSLAPRTIARFQITPSAGVTCTGEIGRGVYANSQQLGGFRMRFTGCATTAEPAESCTSSGHASGEIATSELFATVGAVLTSQRGPRHNVDGVVLVPDERRALAEFSCAGVSMRVTGSVIARAQANRMLSRATLAFSASGARQDPHSFEHGLPAALHVSIGGQRARPIALDARISVFNAEAIELDSTR